MSLRSMICRLPTKDRELVSGRFYPWSLFPNDFNKLFDELRELTASGSDGANLALLTPRVDVSETPTEVHVTAEIPGLQEEDIELSFADNVLMLTGEKKVEKNEDDKEKNYHRVERVYGSFQRAIPIPAEVDADNVDAVYKDGVLHVKLTKKSEGDPRRKINVKKG